MKAITLLIYVLLFVIVGYQIEITDCTITDDNCPLMVPSFSEAALSPCSLVLGTGHIYRYAMYFISFLWSD